MSNIEEIIGSVNTSEVFDKEAWVEKKRQERNSVYEMIDKTAEEVVTDINKYKQYLDVQSKFDKYSVGNALLITAQNPSATRLRDFDGWKEAGLYVSKGAVGTLILEPGDSYTKEDGSVAQMYNPKRVFDISQTNNKQSIKTNHYDDKLMLKALLHECNMNIQVVDDLDGGKVASWNKEDSTLYVKRDPDTKAVFRAITTEMARSDFEGSSEVVDFKSNSVAYLVAGKYGLDNSKIELGNIPSSLQSLEVKDVRNELSSIRSGMEDIDSRISQYLESVTKTQRNVEQER